MSEEGLTSSRTVALESGIRVTRNSVRRERRMGVLQITMKVVVRPLQERKHRGFFVKTRELVERKCVRLLLLYPSNIPEPKNMLAE